MTWAPQTFVKPPKALDDGPVYPFSWDDSGELSKVAKGVVGSVRSFLGKAGHLDVLREARYELEVLSAPCANVLVRESVTRGGVWCFQLTTDVDHGNPDIGGLQQSEHRTRGCSSSHYERGPESRAFPSILGRGRSPASPLPFRPTPSCGTAV